MGQTHLMGVTYTREGIGAREYVHYSDSDWAVRRSTTGGTGQLALGSVRRLHGARCARGTSLCPGHILLFGLVNILFSSLLSKSLPIKGREAAHAEGRAGANTRAVSVAASG